ncbi:hypothetical protein D1818_23705 [Aquimarina sp. BL5]|uniref:hypothetical protein n=1 Tax=Aquimarina sp. BL5 TaxID=1714860 RepID=UPI000E528DD1|nr:hypothetical protein [Aquimarina sp. BL5]AXT53683.1 hypothetical protein D1818_23705 [Aquimarina sp. BL5]RKM91589.1 hypothetical protein D7036_23265 [Aquimarina sp. BL5]
MKKILELKGVQELSKGQQRSIKGANTYISCCNPNPINGSGNRCRISFPGGSFCEPGRCTGWGGCILY